jgi:cytochrome c-type biogenesis protein CcmH
MGWILAIALALLSFGAVIWLGKSRNAWQVTGTALLLGLTGYALQAHPGLSGAPKAPLASADGSAAAMVEARQALSGKSAVQGSNWMVIGDALARHGQFADAAGVLLGAVEKEPNNADAWLALANALAGHADGTVTPASLFAYQRAEQADPAHPGPPFFLGLAMAQSGRFAEARGLWAGLLARSPADAPWRADLAARLQMLDRLIAEQQAAVNPPR